MLIAGSLALWPVLTFAQTSGAPSDGPPTTSPGQELTVGIGGYNYVEPGDHSISIHGVKFLGEYLGTFSLDERRGWFAKANFRATAGSTAYDGWYGPWLIRPDSSSPNGYVLDIGDYSECSDTGNPDSYVEGRGLFGKDFVGRWTWSPEAGLGFRHLSNGLVDVPGYRKENYLHLPWALRGEPGSRREPC